MDRPLFLERPAAFFFLSLAAGLIIGDLFSGYLHVFLYSVPIAGFIVRYRSPHRRRTLIIAAGVFMVLGYVSLQPWVDPHLPADHIKFYADGSRRVVTGRVGNQPERFGNRTRMVLVVETVDRQPACGKLRVTVAGRDPHITTGDRLQFRARIKSIRNFNNPGAFNYRRYLMFQRIWASAWTAADNLNVLEKGSDTGCREKLSRIRTVLSGWISGTLEKRTGSIIAALVTGDRSGITPQQRQQFNRLGIGHLLAISGLHIGIIAAVAFKILYWLCRQTACLVNTGWSRRSAALLTIFPVVAYGLVAGMAPSTQRAVIMVAAFLLATVLDRQTDTLNTLAAAALIITVINPPALFSVSFQLSFGAVFIIVYGLACLPPGWLAPLGKSKKPRLYEMVVNSLTGFFWVSFLAIFGTLPLTMHYFNQVSYVGLLTNYIYIPVVGFVTVPLALAAVVLFPVSNLLADKVLRLAGWVLDKAMDLADYFTDFEWIAAHTVTLNWFEVVCCYSLIILLLQVAKSVSETTGSSNGGFIAPRRFGRVVRAGLVMVILLVAADTVYWFYHRFWHRDLRVTCIDVRQGSAALLEFPGGETMLIDGGGYADNTVFDMGARVVAPLLRHRKILTVDTLVLSHPNSDHLNGLLFIAEHFNVGEIWTNREAVKTAGYRKLKKIIHSRNISWPRYQDLPRRSEIGGVTIDRLYPPDDFMSRQQKEPWRNTNNNSMVLKVTAGESVFLFTGDIMQAAEEELVHMANSRLKSTVLWVPHHGSNSSSTVDFLSRVEPSVAVVSAGQGNWYGFPHPEVLKRLRAIGARVWRTDRHGAITLSARERSLQVKTTLTMDVGP